MGIKSNSVSTSDVSGGRYVTYHDSAVLCVHLTGKNATKWYDALMGSASTAKQDLVQDLRTMHGLDPAKTDKIPDLERIVTNDYNEWVVDPNDCVWSYWKDAGSAWALNSDAATCQRAIQAGVNVGQRVHLCGPAYTTSTPGTIEGALRSVMTTMRYFGSGEEVWRAVCSGDVNEVHRSLVERNGDEEHVDLATGCTLLHRACGDGSVDIAELLIQRGCRVDPSDNNGSTPLHYACIGGHSEIVEVLLSADADVFAMDATGATPYDLARLQGHAKVLSTLSTRHLRRHWTRMHTAPPCQLPLSDVPRLFQDQGGEGSTGNMSPGNSVEQSDNEDDMIMLSIQKAFQQFDSEGVGAISVTDLPALVNVLQEPLTLNEIKDMTRNLDITNTGMVGFQEFHQFWVNSN